MTDNEFTTNEWANTKQEAFELSEEAIAEIQAAAKVFVAVCEKHSAPVIAVTQASATGEGGYQHLIEGSLLSMAKVGPAVLLCGLLPREDDPLAATYAVCSAYSKRAQL